MAGIEDGAVNELEDEGDRIKKTYRRTRRAVVVGLIHLYRSGHFTYLDVEDRLQSEKAGQDTLSDLGVPVPDILEEGEDEGRPYIRLEKIGDGQNLERYVDHLDPDEAYDLAQEQAERIRHLHDNGVTHFDPRLQNMVRGEDDVYFVDHEWFREDAEGQFHEVGLLHLLGAAKKTDPATYAALREGIQDGYGMELSLPRTLKSGFIGFKIAFFNGDIERLSNSVENTWNELRAFLSGDTGEHGGG